MMKFVIGLNILKVKLWYYILIISGITDSINYNFAKIRIDSCNSLLIEKTVD